MKKKGLHKNIKLTRKDAILIAIWIVVFIAFVILFTKFEKNKWFVKSYNRGVDYYREMEYELAESYFTDALWEKPVGKRDCKCRINLALSIVKPITPESVTEENFEEQIERLKTARDYLIENDCAHENDSDGHNKDAQKLKEEIDEYIKELTEKYEDKQQDPEENNDDKDKKEDNKDNAQGDDNSLEKTDPKYEEIKKMMEENEKIGQEERFRKEELFENFGGISSYSGKNW